MAEELKIMQKVFDMMQYGYGALAQYPKSEKFALCTDIKRCMDTMLERTIEAQKKYYKKTTLQDLDVEVAKLRAYLRLSHELGFLPMKKYEVWSGMAVEIGKMLGGWLKTIKSQPKTLGISRDALSIRAATGTTLPMAWLHSTATTRARTRGRTLASAPLYLIVRYCKLAGLLSVQRDKGAGLLGCRVKAAALKF